MYVDVLHGALEAWDSPLTGRALLDYVVECRNAFLASGSTSAYHSLAAEVAYDRALVALCTEVGIGAAAADFADPIRERSRLEGQLRQGVGIDLVSLSKSNAAQKPPAPRG